nr:PREDICTED: cysteine-rich protein 2-binding protein [Bemisia tabaci]
MKYPMIIGDVFYFFTCKGCNKKDELVLKVKPKWSDILLVVLYSLQEHSSNISRDGYFHWKVHICSFINEHWKSLFGTPKSKRGPNWRATVTGTLDHYQSYFKSRESTPGWWKLTHAYWPQRVIEICEKKKAPELLEPPFEDGEKKVRRKTASKVKSTPKRTSKKTPITNNKDDVPETNGFDSDDQVVEGTVAMTLIPNPPHEKLYDHHYCRQYLVPINARLLQNGGNYYREDPSESFNIPTSESLPIEAGNTGQASNSFTYSNFSERLTESEIPALLAQVRKPVRTRRAKISNLETLLNSIDEEFPSLCNFSEEEEHELLKRIYKVTRIIPKADKYKVLRKLFRILDLRRFRRMNDVSMLSSSDPISDDLVEEMRKKTQQDALRHFETVHTDESHPNWFKDGTQWKTYSSPYTSRVLKPLIFRDNSMKPVWLKLMEEIRHAVFLKKLKSADGSSQENLSFESSDTSIDYSYVSPHFLLALNSLSCRFFWPGIQLLECLHYPDFTCVATYKKLIIGFGVMIPNLDVNEAYITYLFVRPYWRKCGIATFIIYHLIQSCMGKDITLHVSADNEAIFLYQKFGFKIEDYILNFYDRYMLLDSTESRHAFFLRFSR